MLASAVTILVTYVPLRAAVKRCVFSLRSCLVQSGAVEPCRAALRRSALEIGPTVDTKAELARLDTNTC